LTAGVIRLYVKVYNMSSKSVGQSHGWSYHFERRGRAAVEGRHLPSVGDLLSGMCFYRANLVIDAQTWSERLLLRWDRVCNSEQFVDLKSALQRLTVSPDVGDFIYAASVMRDQAHPSESWLTRFDGELRCKVYAAALSDRDSIIVVVREIRKHISEIVSGYEEIQAGLGVLLRLLGRLDDVASSCTGTTFSEVPCYLSGAFDQTLRRLVMGIRAADKPKHVGNLRAVEEDAVISPELAQNEPGLIVFKKIGNEVFSDNDRLKKTLEPFVGRKLPLVPLPNLQQVRSVLFKEFPHAGNTIDAIVTDLMTRKSVALRPTVLAGLPGCGKTSFAMRLAELLGVAATLYGCGGIADSSFAGTARRWSNGEPALPVGAIISANVANPLFILDEIEKAGTSTTNGNLFDSLLSMLEPKSSSRFFDVYIQSEVDLSAVVWIATSNDPTLLPRPLRDRCRILSFPSPTVEHLPTLAQSILIGITAERGLDPRWVGQMSGDEMSALANAWPGGSLRGLYRLIEGVLAARDAMAGVH
jgi:hypothetical protein